MLYSLARQALFLFDAETSHHLALSAISASHKLGLTCLFFNKPVHPVQFLGMECENPVGLAAGLDKNGDYIDALAALGFGFIEIGTVTPRPQPGNPKPRLFRLPQKLAIINRMGFNNKGVDHLVEQVKCSKYKGVLGINIGKNFDTPVEDALSDYLKCLEKVYPLASYVTINISSPNTQGLRSLQYGESLSELLAGLKKAQEELAEKHGKYVPLLVKIAPDLEADEVVDIAKRFIENNIDGVIATNTTLSREGVENLTHGQEQGGLSGAPVLEKSNQVLKQLVKALDGAIPVMGVGGITQGSDAKLKLQAGAELVQVYSGFIYKGPKLIADCVKAIATFK